MPKVHFFKLASELGERPVEFLKKLAAAGIAVRSTSTMVDDETADKIREYARQEAARHQAAAPAVVVDEAKASAVDAAETPKPAEVPAAAEPSSSEQAAPAPEAPRTAPRVIKRIPSADVQRGEARSQAAGAAGSAAPTRPGQRQPPVQQPADAAGAPPAKKKPRSMLVTPIDDGGLSPDAEFGIVKAAGIVPMAAPRPERPLRRPGPAGSGEFPRPPRPEGGFTGPRPPRPPMGGAGQNIPPPEPGAATKGPAARSGAPTAAKKKQKRTIFSDKDKARTPQKRPTDFSSTTLRGRRKRRTGGGGGTTSEPVGIELPVVLTGPITVGELAARVQLPPAQLITQLISMGIMATMNQQIEAEQAVTVLEKLEIEALVEVDMLEQANWRLTATSGNDTVATGAIRPPVVTILGHVDHGKTTLLDSIRKTHVTEQEFGGITQHIGAYQVEISGKKITFLDTPGHAAFTAMRARGANLTDIAVLVVAADDGIQPQTVEAIDHAKAAKVPIIVAINKIDAPAAQPESVKQQLTMHGLVAEAWGGDTIMVELSAKEGTNIDQLLEMILLVAEVQELRAESDKPARGAVVESRLDKQRGALTTILIQDGTLHVGDALVVGMVSGKIRAMADDKGRPLREAGPSTPVEILGLTIPPEAGDLFEVVSSERKAREIAESRILKARDERLSAHVSLQNLSSMVASGIVKDLNIIVKTDVAGSIEAISHQLSQIEHEEIRVNIIHAGVGDITESDVLLASASNAIIVGFHVKSEMQARMIAEEAGIDLRVYTVIYEIVDDIEKAMLGMLAPIFEETILGHAQVRAMFKTSRYGVIAGCYVTDGVMRRGAKIRVKRGDEVVFTGVLDSLKHLKEDVREMATNFECGISLNNFNAWQENDIIECYIIQELRRESLT